jgi:RNA polymerase sigma factor (sigma-70 family)
VACAGTCISEDGIAIAKLVANASSGLDERRVDELLADLRPLVVRTVRLVVGAGSVVAEDAAQEALLEMSRSLPQLRSVEAAPAWAMTIATRMALRIARKEARLWRLGLQARIDARSAPGEMSFQRVALKEAFDRLPPRQRAIAVLRLYVGFSEAETAAAVGCSVGTVKSQLHDARRSLAASLGSTATEGEQEGC